MKQVWQEKKSTIVLHSMLSIALLAGSSARAQSVKHDDEARLPPGVVKQSATEAHDADVALLAAELDVSFEEAARSIDFQETFVEYVKELTKRYPDQISRIWLDPAPALGGHVQFTAAVPSELAPQHVHLSGDGVLSLSEHHRRAEIAAEALRAAGYRNFVSYFDATRSVARIEMRIPNDAPDVDRELVLAIVQERIWKDLDLVGEALVVAPADLDVEVVRGAGEIYEREHSRGGNWLLDDGARECTSGWSVDGPSGDGIITAAHCVGLNQFEEPGLAPYSMSWRSQERGDGDTEYHTTSHIELPEFFATSVSIRDTNSTMATIFMFPGTSVCVYGRSSNSRSCAHAVEATFVTVTFTDGVTVSGLVRASGDTSIPGDSGGGWSWSTTAWGVHSGSNGQDSYFTPIDLAESELGVDVMLAP